jgi:hypothetical protein
MPPRRSARVAAVAERQSSALSPLPLAIVLHIFSVLPLDERARCALVCRGWRAAVSEPSLWTRLHLSATAGLTFAVTDSALLSLAAKARGALQQLAVTFTDELSHDTLLEVATASAGALRELRTCAVKGKELGYDEVCALARAAPLLRLFQADVACGDVAQLRRMLRNEDELAPLQLRRLRIAPVDDADEEDTLSAADVTLLAPDLAAHAHVEELDLYRVQLDTDAALEAVIDAALACAVRSFTLLGCTFLPRACALGLARLLRGGSLTELLVEGDGDQRLADAASAGVLCTALRDSTTLTALRLIDMSLWSDAAVATALLAAVTAHGSLRELQLQIDHPGARAAAAGAAFGALVAANVSALQTLDLAFNSLHEETLRALFNALPGNTHLRTLRVSYETMSAAFARDVLLPAVRANTSLRALHMGYGDVQRNAGAREALTIVNSRAAAH